MKLFPAVALTGASSTCIDGHLATHRLPLIGRHMTVDQLIVSLICGGRRSSGGPLRRLLRWIPADAVQRLGNSAASWTWSARNHNNNNDNQRASSDATTTAADKTVAERKRSRAADGIIATRPLKVAISR